MTRDQVEKWKQRLIREGGEFIVAVEVAKDLYSAGILQRKPTGIRGRRYIGVQLKKGLMS